MSYNTTVPQFALTPDALSEIPVAQYSGSTIAAFSGVVLDTTNQIRGATPGSTWAENMSIAVKLPTASSPAVGSVGILRENLPSGGQLVSCITRSVCCPVRAAGSISATNLLSICTVSGKLGRFQVAVTGEEIVAQALMDASDGDIFLVRLFGSVSIHA